jgi:hypothetical protein
MLCLKPFTIQPRRRMSLTKNSAAFDRWMEEDRALDACSYLHYLEHKYFNGDSDRGDGLVHHPTPTIGGRRPLVTTRRSPYPRHYRRL